VLWLLLALAAVMMLLVSGAELAMCPFCASSINHVTEKGEQCVCLVILRRINKVCVLVRSIIPQEVLDAEYDANRLRP